MKFATTAATDKPERDARGGAEQREHQRLGQELPQDLPGEAPIAARMPISCVRSATDTSWMFMMPMPPTSSETAAMPASSAVRMPADLLGHARHLVRAR